ncbi:conserved Plasmodium protein, unknown function [Plasmodium gallinaceum]|uniref:Uncharacterized protein n=1 Tax=Plasmodium gallinaceum TaxID=5849 RepID=A0A1J1GR02_PLAGA|nr:conserved Plasmodium protein, unknown function [Plasmodium gallinaceum]CRG93466.1 conserved Plasmodium protein, unknown function [Plasmodium gallinaceum]
MEEVSCIPGYKNINIEALYRPQEDYAFVNDIKAKKFVYNPYFKRELEGPFIEEYYEHYEGNKALKHFLFSPHIVSPQKSNRQCNPFVAYPYGVPQDPLYEKCPKCKGNKKYRKKKNNKTKYYYENDYFSSKLKPCSSSRDFDSHEDNYYSDNEDIHYFNYSHEENCQRNNFNNSPYLNNFENIYSNGCKTEEKSNNSVENFDVDDCNKISSLTDYPRQNDENSEYFYSYNEKANMNSQEEIKKYIEIYHSRNNFHSNDCDYEQNDSNDKSLGVYKTNDTNAEEYQSTIDAEKENEIEAILNEYSDMIQTNEMNKFADNKDETNENNKELTKDNDELNSEKITIEIKNKNIKYNVKNDKNSKQYKKQVKICENENVLTKYNVTENFKKHEVSKENIKAKSPLQNSSQYSQEYEKKKNEHNGRFCKLINSKYEIQKKLMETKNKKEKKNSLELSTSNDEETFGSSSPKKIYVKYRKLSLDKNNSSPKKRNEKEINYKNLKSTIPRARSLKVKSVINLSTKNSNLPLRKKNYLNKLNSLTETKFKKQNTFALKKRKSISRLNSIKSPNRVILNKKKIENTEKSISSLDNKKKRDFQSRSKKFLSRSKTKVYVNNESKLFKKSEVKMLSKTPFNPHVSEKKSKINESDDDKKKRIKDISKTKRRTNLNFNANTPKINSTSIRNKLKSKKKELFENILSLTKNMKENPLKKEYNDKIEDGDFLSIISNNSNDDVESSPNENNKNINLTTLNSTVKKKKH